MQEYIQPTLIATIGHAPVIGALFSGTPFGLGVLTAGIILAFMVLPFIASVTRDVFMTVPPMLRESAYGVGATTSEVVRTLCCRLPAPAWSAASCWGSAAPWARPWPSPLS